MYNDFFLRHYEYFRFGEKQKVYWFYSVIIYNNSNKVECIIITLRLYRSFSIENNALRSFLELFISFLREKPNLHLDTKIGKIGTQAGCEFYGSVKIYVGLFFLRRVPKPFKNTKWSNFKILL